MSEKETLKRINNLSDTEAEEAFLRCCGSLVWAGQMAVYRPYATFKEMEERGESLWPKLTNSQWRQAFTHHPKIGDIDSLRTKFASTASWAGGEQSGTAQASEKTLHALAHGNAAYENRFGYIFIVCATGKSADEMLALLTERLTNDPETEIVIAAEEQKKITRLRLRKL